MATGETEDDVREKCDENREDDEEGEVGETDGVRENGEEDDDGGEGMGTYRSDSEEFAVDDEIIAIGVDELHDNITGCMALQLNDTVDEREEEKVLPQTV